MLSRTRACLCLLLIVGLTTLVGPTATAAPTFSTEAPGWSIATVIDWLKRFWGIDPGSSLLSPGPAVSWIEKDGAAVGGTGGGIGGTGGGGGPTGPGLIPDGFQ